MTLPATPPRSHALPQPLYFGPAEAPLAGWFHAAPGRARMAVLVCGSWGDEELGSHRGLYQLAEQLAQHGLPVLRFDLPGEGDSFEPSVQPEADRWPLWLAAAQAALAVLKQRSGAPRLAVLGLRLGTLLAAHAVAGRDDVAALVALLPPPGGRGWLRELRLMTRESTASRADGGLVAGGFELNAASVASLTALRLPPHAGPPALLLERSELPLPESTLAAWRDFARPLDHERRNDLRDVLAIAHSASLPQAVRSQVVGWLQARAAAGPLPPSAAPVPACAAEAVLAQGLYEVVVQIPGPGGALQVGVLARPASPAGVPPGTPALLLLSSGAERHIGPHRLWVPLARERARRGELVLRLDLAGLGNSPDRPGEPEAQVHDARGAADVTAAVAWLRREFEVGPVTVAGICSGAYQSWRAALNGAAVQAVVLVNPLVFDWRPGMSLDPAAHAFGQIAIAAQAARASRDPRRWLKLLRGQVHVRVILAALLAQAISWWQRHARSLRGWWGGLITSLGRRPAAPQTGHDLAREMQFVARRGVLAHFLFAEGEPGRTLLEREAGRALARLSRDGHVQLATVQQADHTFTQQAARLRLYNQLNPLLDDVSRRRSHPDTAAAPRPGPSQPPPSS